MTDTATELRKYEMMLIFSGELTESAFEKELTDMRKTLQEGTKGITHEDLWGRRDLAFALKKQRRGYYVVFNFNAEPAHLRELRTAIALNPVVLRHMLVTVPENYDPMGYKHDVLPMPEKETEPARRPGSARRSSIRTQPPELSRIPEERTIKAPAATKDEAEQLKTVEKKLEKILENPDIDIS